MTPKDRRRKAGPASQRTKVLADIAEVESIEAESASSPRSSVLSRKRGRDRTQELRKEGVAWNASQELQLFRGLACAVTAELDLHRLVATVLDQAIQVLGARRGILFLGRPDAVGLIPVLATSMAGEELSEAEMVSRTILAKGRAGQVVVTRDALSDPRFQNIPSIQRNEMRSILCAPLSALSGPVGVLYLDAPGPDAFPESVEALLESIAKIAAVALENARVHGDLAFEAQRLRAGQRPAEPFERFVGTSTAMGTVRRMAEIAARLERPIQLIGEPGTGRRFLARLIHEASHRAWGRFVDCDAALVQQEQLRDVLLGRMGVAARGGAGSDVGLIRDAERGTLHIAGAEQITDEIGGQLLSLVQRRSYRPLGGRTDQAADVRLILSMQTMSMAGGIPVPMPGKFHAKIDPFQIVIPPLREHLEDVPALVDHFSRASMDDTRGMRAITFAPDAMDALCAHSWPDNVQGLERVVRQLIYWMPQSRVGADQVRKALVPATVPESSKIRTLLELEEDAIRGALLHTGGNKSEAAKLLGIHRNTLLLRLKDMRSRE